MLANNLPEPTPEERQKIRFRARLKKAEHLSARVGMFLLDLNGVGFKSSEKKEIIHALYKQIPFTEL